MSLSNLLACLTTIIVGLTHTSASPANASYRGLGKCPTLEDGSRCFGRPWQHDGVCFYDRGVSECVSPVALKYHFRIEAKYLPTSTKSVRLPKRMFLRGSGPGLSWEKSIEMKESPIEHNTWTVDVQYTSDFNSLLCKNSSECSLNQGALEFRVYTDEQAIREMKGPNFYFPLPISNSLEGSEGFKVPAITVYPWFNRESARSMDIEYQQLKGRLVFPPSFDENAHRRYPLVVMLEDDYHYIPLFEFLLAHTRVVEEVILLLIKPNELNVLRDKRSSILPFDSMNLECKTHDCIGCQVCWSSKIAEPCDREEFITRSRRCLFFRRSKGVGERLLIDIIYKLAEDVKRITRDRVKFDPPKERITLIGYGEEAVTAFMMGLTRPDLVKNVASLSPKFYLPLTTKYTTGNAILRLMDRLAPAFTGSAPLQALYASQKYYISHGELDSVNFPIARAIQVTENVIRKLRDKFKMKSNVNLVFHVVPGESIRYPSRHPFAMMSLIQTLMIYFHKAEGGASEKYARAVVLRELFFAERQLPHGPAAGDVPIFGGSDDEEIEIGIECSLSQRTFPMTVFIGSIGCSVFVSVLITAVLMYLREASRKADDEDQADVAENSDDSS